MFLRNCRNQAFTLRTPAGGILSVIAIFQQVTPSGASCVILNRRWIMHLPTLWLCLPVLIVYSGLVTLWSSWPEKHGGWLLAMKQRLPPALQPLHPKYVLAWLALACVLGLCLEFLELK